MRIKKILICIMMLLLLSLFLLALFLIDDLFLKIFSSIVVFVLFCCFLYIFIIEVFIGHNEYFYNKNKNTLIIKRKNRLLEIVDKNDITNIIVIFDYVNSETVEEIVFVYKKRKYRIVVNKDNKLWINDFLFDLNFKKKTNVFKHLIDFVGFFTC